MGTLTIALRNMNNADFKLPRHTSGPGLSPERLRGLPKGYFFSFLLALAFLPPDYRLLYFPALGGVILSAREVCLLILPVVYYFFYPNRSIHVIGVDLRKLIFVFFGIIVLAEVLKMGFYRQSVFDIAKNIRTGIPLFSGLLIIVQGVKMNPKSCIGMFLGILAISLLLTPLMFLLGIEPGYRDLGHGEIDLELVRQGRFYNQNFGFAFIGVVALLISGNWKQTGRTDRTIYCFLLAASAFAVLVAVLTFNRTYLAGISLVSLFCTIRYFRASLVLKVVLVALLGIGPSVLLYKSNDEVQRQVDKRILDVVEDPELFLESVYYDNRDVLYSYYLDRLQQYWMVGLPGYLPVWVSSVGTNSKSDISLYNIWIRYGVCSFIIFMIISGKMFFEFRRRLARPEDDNLGSGVLRAVVISLPFYFLAGLNIDALVSHNSIFFILFLLTFSATWAMNEKNDIRWSRPGEVRRFPAGARQITSPV